MRKAEAIALAEKDPMYVRLPVYDGPLELLIELIRKNEVDVYDIPVAEITKQYLESIAEMKRLDLEVAGEFLVMAATLIYIKSKLLLPDETAEEEEDGEDPRAELVRKILEYQAFKEAAKELSTLEDERSQIFTRKITDYYLTDLDPEEVGIDNFSANLYDLLSAFQNVLSKAGKEHIHEVIEEVVSIDDKIAEVKNILSTKKKIKFSELFNKRWSRNILIVTFLALLEIVRTKLAIFKQDKEFGEIVIQKRDTAAQ